MALGVQFDREQGELCLGREAAHSRPRILHAQGDTTGAELVRVLTLAVRQTAGIEIAEAWVSKTWSSIPAASRV